MKRTAVLALVLFIAACGPPRVGTMPEGDQVDPWPGYTDFCRRNPTDRACPQ